MEAFPEPFAEYGGPAKLDSIFGLILNEKRRLLCKLKINPAGKVTRDDKDKRILSDKTIKISKEWESCGTLIKDTETSTHRKRVAGHDGLYKLHEKAQPKHQHWLEES